MALGYRTEARFYRDFSDHLSEGLPEHYFADADEHTGQGIVVMPDITASGARFGHPGSPLTVDQAADALGAQAIWHSRSAPEVPWLTVRATSTRSRRPS